MQPEPPFALRNVNTRALPEPERDRVREELKRVRASSRASEPAAWSRYSPAPARMLATMAAGCDISPLAKIAICRVVARINSIVRMARWASCGEMSTMTTSARESCNWRKIASVGPVGNPTWLNTALPSRVASSRFCSVDRWSRSSVRRATAIPCIARFSLISIGVCMLEREGTLRQVT